MLQLTEIFSSFRICFERVEQKKKELSETSGEEILSAADSRSRSPPLCSLIDVLESAYLSAAFGLDERSLCHLDLTCRSMFFLNSALYLHWRALGIKRYENVELDREGKFGNELLEKFGEEIFSAADARSRSPPLFSLIDVPESAYLSAAFGLDERSLCQLDLTCRSSWLLNSAPCGPWRALGIKRYRNVELDREGKFGEPPSTPPGARIPRPMSWKCRYFRYGQALPNFCARIEGRKIIRVSNPGELWYCQFMVTRQRLSADIDVGVYIEFHARSNPDCVAVALVDLDARDSNSMTFIPDTGTVIRERKVQDTLGMMARAYIQPLNAGQAFEGRFEGSLGIYINAGHIAFFRRRDYNFEQPSAWETTGYIDDFSWTDSPCVIPCMRFRDEGIYHAQMVGVGSVPPKDPGLFPSGYDESRWDERYWDED